MEVEIRGRKGIVLNMIKHQDANIYEVQLINSNKDVEVIIHRVKTEEINILQKESKGDILSFPK